jgi:hypothetical protein
MAKRRRRNPTLLWVLLALSVAYLVALYALPTLAGTNVRDGSIGVLFGLYTCSRAAANLIDLLFLERSAPREESDLSGLAWLGLNMLVILVGCVDVIIGAMRFAGRAA